MRSRSIGERLPCAQQHSRGGGGYTRREFGALALGAVAAVVSGVHVGIQTYSFRMLPRAADGDAVPALLAAMRACGLDECELWTDQIEPLGLSRADLRLWRLKTPLDHFRRIASRFAAAGISVYAYNYSPRASFTDEEIDRGFDIATALGAEILSSSTTIEVAKRIVPFAEQHRMVVAMHGHSNVANRNEFATPASFAAALEMSKYFRINLDIGHLTAAGFDPVAFIREQHAAITHLHVKDMRKNQEESYVPWGEGDAPIADVLRLVKQQGWPIRAYIEYEYEGRGTPVEEVKKCYRSIKQALA